MASDTVEFLAGVGVLARTPEVFRRDFPSATAFLVADETTWRVAGSKVGNALREARIPVAGRLVFPAAPRPVADYEHLEEVRRRLAGAGREARAVAIGAGTINDLCKRASEELGRPYLCVATAASVDGYASFGAPITRDGFKSTWPCAAPRAIVADTGVLLTAPTALTASGYADLAAKITGGADWILADAMGLDPVRGDVWETTQRPLRGWLSRPAELAAGAPSAMTGLITGLAMTGFAMQATRSSRPASGAEHLFAHVWEMWGVTKADGDHPSHGEKVAIGTLCTTAMMTSFFRRPFTSGEIGKAVAAYPSPEALERRIHALFGSGPVGQAALERTREKHPSPATVRNRLRYLSDHWDDLAGKIGRQLIPTDDLRSAFRAAGCPLVPEEIGVRREDVPRCALGAQLIRNRYTILDLALETGRLDGLADGLRTIW